MCVGVCGGARLCAQVPGFLISYTLLTSEGQYFCCEGAALCIVEYLAVPLTSSH